MENYKQQNTIKIHLETNDISQVVLEIFQYGFKLSEFGKRKKIPKKAFEYMQH